MRPTLMGAEMAKCLDDELKRVIIQGSACDYVGASIEVMRDWSEKRETKVGITTWTNLFTLPLTSNK